MLIRFRSRCGRHARAARPPRRTFDADLETTGARRTSGEVGVWSRVGAPGHSYNSSCLTRRPPEDSAPRPAAPAVTAARADAGALSCLAFCETFCRGVVTGLA